MTNYNSKPPIMVSRSYIENITEADFVNLSGDDLYSKLIGEINKQPWKNDAAEPIDTNKSASGGVINKVIKIKNKSYLVAVGFVPSNDLNKNNNYCFTVDGDCKEGSILGTNKSGKDLSDIVYALYKKNLTKSIYVQECDLEFFDQDYINSLSDDEKKKHTNKIYLCDEKFLGINSLRTMGQEIKQKYEDVGVVDVTGSTNMSVLNESGETDENESLPQKNEQFRNIILSGPPGVGKSYIVDKFMIPEIIEDEKDWETNVERITLTLSTTYEDFFGCYKPQMEEYEEDGEQKKRITYEFIPGAFCTILKKALLDPNNKNFVLVVEELNRTDVYDVFGQVFQLLDRNDDGDSSYKVSMPLDAKRYFEKTEDPDVPFKPNIDFAKLWIPKNLYIICTMNSADQGVHILDTAFKRRFEMVYIDIDGNIYAPIGVPLKEDTPNWDKSKNKSLTAKEYHAIRKAINEQMKNDKSIADDKMISERFINTRHSAPGKFDDGRPVDYVEFIVKVLGYLLQNVYKSKAISTYIFNSDLNNRGERLTLWGLLKNGKLSKILSPNIIKEAADIEPSVAKIE